SPEAQEHHDPAEQAGEPEGNQESRPEPGRPADARFLERLDGELRLVRGRLRRPGRGPQGGSGRLAHQYTALPGTTQRTPPRGSATSPSYRGITWKWRCATVCPAAPPSFRPRLKPSGRGSSSWDRRDRIASTHCHIASIS